MAASTAREAEEKSSAKEDPRLRERLVSETGRAPTKDNVLIEGGNSCYAS